MKQNDKKQKYRNAALDIVIVKKGRTAQVKHERWPWLHKARSGFAQRIHKLYTPQRIQG
jgi:hypothetical protein